jgi:hypothetical protein
MSARTQRDRPARARGHDGPARAAVRRLHTPHSTDCGYPAAIALRTWRRGNQWMFLHFLGPSGLVVFAAIVPTAGDRHASSTVMTTPEEWCERALLRSLDQEVRPAMLTVTAERARAEAAAGPRRRRTRTARSDLDGVPITWKDVFDVEGTVTTAGSASRSGYPRAAVDSRLVRRARDLGLVTVGKTNLSEFAFSGLGVNEHFGTPPNPNDAALVPGGSSAGAAVAVTAGVAPLAMGTDTSGSVRVPAPSAGASGSARASIVADHHGVELSRHVQHQLAAARARRPFDRRIDCFTAPRRGSPPLGGGKQAHRIPRQSMSSTLYTCAGSTTVSGSSFDERRGCGFRN